jgi:hypothetical protein
MPVGRLRKRRRDRTLAAVHRQKAKGRSQSRCESTKTVIIAGKTTSCRAIVAWLKGDIARRECTGDNIASRTQRGRTSELRPWIGPECNNGIRGRGLNQKATRQNRNKGPRRKTANASSDRTDVRWDRREDLQIGKREANSRIIYGVTKTEEMDLAMLRHTRYNSNNNNNNNNKLHDFSPQEIYTDRATVACRRS